MRDYELELIAALAEGRLDDEAEARALIESSEEARSEYESQTRALEALGSAGPISMTERERNALRRDVWTELRASKKETAPLPWYYKWIPAAAGLFLVVGLVGVLAQGGNDDGGAVAAEMDGASETTAQGSETTLASMNADADAGDDDIREEATGGDGEAADGEGAQPLAPDTAAFFSLKADEIRTDEGQDEQARAGEPTQEQVEECLDHAGLSGYEIREVSTSLADDRDVAEVPSEAPPYVAAVPAGADLSDAEVTFVHLEDCEVIHVDR